MTTGTYVVDGRYNLPDPNNALNLVYGLGPYQKRVWNGADYAGKRKPVAYAPPQDELGRYWHPSNRKKRNLEVEQHSYETTSFFSNDDLIGTQGKSNSSSPWPTKYNWRSGANGGVFGSIPAIAGNDPWTIDDTNKLFAKLREEIAGSDFNPAIFLAEMPEALQMIGGAATNLANAIRHFRRGNFRAAAEALSRGSGRNVRASSRWLEMQYGWMPLLQDMEGGARFIARQLDEPVYRVKVSHRAQRFSGWSARADYLQLTGGSDVVPYVLDFSAINGLRSRQIICYLKTGADGGHLTGLYDPTAVLWELVPFSFIVDWAYPIGAYLSNLSLSRALTGTFVTTDVWRIRGSGCKIGGATNRSLFRFTGGEGCFVSAIRLNRTVSTNLSIPRPSTRPVAKIASLTHCLNALALLSGSMSDLGVGKR